MAFRRNLSITTIATCPVNCAKYCPQDKLGLAYHGSVLLLLENFKRALTNVPHDVEIVFSGYGEPFLNPQCKEMILYAHKEGYSVHLYSTFSNITLETWHAIKHIPFKIIQFHLPDADGVTKVKIDAEYLNVLNELKTFPNVSFLSMGDLVPELQPILPNYKNSFVNNKRAGYLEEFKAGKKFGKLFCHKLNAESTQYVMLPDCTVTLCCMDYGLRHRIGNLLETKYDELYGSQEMLRILNSVNKFADPYALCRTCMWADNTIAKLSKRGAFLILNYLHLSKIVETSVKIRQVRSWFGF